MLFRSIVIEYAGATGSAGATGFKPAIPSSIVTVTQVAYAITGATGIRGASGVQGASGSTGPQGASGINGASGTIGVNGASGVQGIQGASGANGASGTIGVDGASGSTGPTGATGIRGASGVQGASGSTGPTGATGSGVQGASGATGVQGASGSAGLPAVAGSAAFGEMTITNNSTAVTLTNQTQYYLTTQWVAGDLNGLSFASNQLTSNVSTSFFMVASLSFKSDKANQLYQFAMYKNGSILAEHTVQIQVGNANAVFPAALSGVISNVVPGDAFDIRVENLTSAGAGVTVIYGNFTMNALSGSAGATGATGITGASGVQGATGPTGATGVSGATGVQGLSGDNLSNETLILNNVAPTTTYNGADVTQWSASYTGQGGQLLVQAEITSYTASAAARNWYLKKNGSTVATGSFFFNATNTHMTLPVLSYIDTTGSTTAATWSITLGTSLIVDTQDRASIIVTEFTGINSLNVSSLTASGTVSGRELTSSLSSGDEGGQINLAVPVTNTSLANSVTVDVYQNKLRMFEGSASAKGVSINLNNAPAGVGGELAWKVSNFVNAGTYVTMDNIKATVTTSGQRGLSLATVSGSITYMIGGSFGYVSGAGGGSSNGTATLTTTPTSSFFGWSFPDQGAMSIYIVTDITNSRNYRITLQIGGGYLNNFICIERLI